MMSENDNFFLQEGHGLVTYGGMRYQKGHGFFGRLMSGLGPLLRYLGTKGLTTAASVASEVAENPADFKSISKRKLAETTATMFEDGAKRTKRFVQDGKGVHKYAHKPINTISKQTTPRKRAKTSKKKTEAESYNFLKHNV